MTDLKKRLIKEAQDNGSFPPLTETRELSKAEIRLAELRVEFKKGQNLLAQKQTEMAQLQETLFRIAGAIQVLEEISEAD